MKRLIIVLIGICLMFLSGCGIYNLSFFTIPDDTKFLETIEKLSTPLEISDYMMRNFTYELHSLYAPDPYTLWLTKKGDCNDFSSFSTWIANYHGYETFTIQIFDGSFFSHIIAVYNEDIWLSFTDNQYYYFGFDNFQEIVEYDWYLQYKIWTKFVVRDYWNNIVEEVFNHKRGK